MLCRNPITALRPLVKTLWATEPSVVGFSNTRYRERVLPTGTIHLVFRSSACPLRILDEPDQDRMRVFGHALVVGARTRSYLREVTPDGISVGAELQPGASLVLFDAQADSLTECHTALDNLWGTRAASACDRIFSARDAAGRLDALETILAAHLPRVHGLHPAIATALAGFRKTSDVNSVVAASGYSHRHFIELFTRATGLAPKRYCRVRRFRQLLASAATHPAAAWTELALTGGYSDQAHFTREFRAFAGITPGEYRRAAPRYPHHVPVFAARI